MSQQAVVYFSVLPQLQSSRRVETAGGEPGRRWQEKTEDRVRNITARVVTSSDMCHHHVKVCKGIHSMRDIL